MNILPLFILLICATTVRTQNNSEPNLLQILSPNLITGNEYANLLFPASIVFAETPIAVRYALLVTVAFYEVEAACHPKALSFFGAKQDILSSFCKPLPRAKLNAYIVNRVYRSQFPIEGGPLEAFLLRNGLAATSQSRDPSKVVGLANIVADKILDYFENDGWNSLGDVTRDDYLRQYAPSIPYMPQNHPNLPVSKLRRPLRWQPLTLEGDGHGRFISQVHVVPQIGRKVKPLVLSQADFRSRKAPSPYDMPDRRRNLSEADENKVRGLIGELFNKSQSLTFEQIALASWWENKFFSLGSFILFYQAALGYDATTVVRYGLGEMLAQYDALLLAWKEKLRHDLVRPTTIIRRLLKGRKVLAFRGAGKGVGLVNADEWEPIIKIQPHSEYPSASATICQASLEHLEAALKEQVGQNGMIPPFEANLTQAFVPTLTLTEPFRIKFDTLLDAARSCGNSRLYAGVHFSPSVPAGYKIAEGVGRKAYEHVSDLWAGRVPENCARCFRH